jgi:hypothetical protein
MRASVVHVRNSSACFSAAIIRAWGNSWKKSKITTSGSGEHELKIAQKQLSKKIFFIIFKSEYFRLYLDMMLIADAKTKVKISWPVHQIRKRIAHSALLTKPVFSFINGPL